jgi:hypothetical protein
MQPVSGHAPPTNFGYRRYARQRPALPLVGNTGIPSAKTRPSAANHEQKSWLSGGGAALLDELRQGPLAGPLIARLAEHPHKSFAHQAAWTAHLDRLGWLSRLIPDPVMVATEGALWGSIKAHGFLGCRAGNLESLWHL